MKNKRKIIAIFTIIFLLLGLQSNIVAYSEESTNKVIHLTFDDGPGGKVTEEVLDILKEEDVPATFFLIGSQIKDQEDLILRMKNEGHSLGLHSMSHKKCNLYSSNDNFLKEMLDTQKVICDVTGESPNILRFPFGCNNTSYHLKSQLVDLLHENNLKIYDWNVDTTDGANHTAPPSTFIKNAKSDKDEIFLLMHCGYANKNSAKALPEIIKYYKNRGYKFEAIDDDTNEMFHYMKHK